MKKLILIPLLLLAIFAAGQNYQKKSGNWEYTGYSKFQAEKLTIGTTPLTETKIQNYDSALADSLSPEGILVRVEDSTINSAYNYSSAYDLYNQATQRDELKVYALDGGTWQSIPLGHSAAMADQAAVADGQLSLCKHYIPVTTTLTNIVYELGVTGSYTPADFNGVALYKLSNDSLLRVAISADVPTALSATQDTRISIPFTSPYIASPGFYYATILYNNSAQATAPQLKGTNMSYGVVNSSMTRKLGGFVAGQASFPAFILHSAISTTPHQKGLILK